MVFHYCNCFDIGTGTSLGFSALQEPGREADFTYRFNRLNFRIQLLNENLESLVESRTA